VESQLKHVLFDLDGTLLDSAECITESVRRAFRQCHYPIPDDAAIRTMIGIPIETSFPALMGAGPTTDPARVAELISTYRIVNAQLAPDMLRLFPGVIDMLHRLRDADRTLSIVTSKKTGTAAANLEQHNIRHLFAVVIGSDLCSKHKPDPEPAFVCQRALGDSSRSASVEANYLVVGDSIHDIRMAAGANIPSIGVSWGVHSPAQLYQAGARAVAAHCEDLVQMLLNS